MSTPEASFPRGRQPRASPLKEDSKRKALPDKDFLFGDHKKAAAKKRKTLDSSKQTSKQASKQKKQETLIEALSFNKLGKGTKLLGIVRQVFDDFCLVSLPNLLTGYVLNKSGDSKSLHLQLSVGQVLAVYVVKTATETIGSGKQQQHRKRIQLSVEPHHLNEELSRYTAARGRITSVEDYGVMVDLGNGRKGFCKYKAVEGENYVTTIDDETPSGHVLLNTGRVHDFLLAGPDTKETQALAGQIVQLSLPSQTTLAKKSWPPAGQYHPTLGSLNPGSLVDVKIKSLAKNGLIVKFGGGSLFEGAIHLNHFGTNWIPTNRNESTEWKDIFGDFSTSLTARIICVDVKTKLIRLSMQPHVLNLCRPQATAALPAVGSIIENATVIRIDPGIGALLSLPPPETEEAQDVLPIIASKRLHAMESYQQALNRPAAYVHISKTTSSESDNRITNAEFARNYAPSTQHSLRILNTTHWMEGVAGGACSSEILAAHVVQHDDLKPSQVYRNVPVCGQLKGGSVMVDFGMGIRGLIPKLHLFDNSNMASEYRTKLSKEKYALDHKVNIRVLEVDVAKKRCVVTAKKSLLKEPGFMSYSSIKIGEIGTGFVSSVDAKSLYITFYNNVYGRVTAKSLAAELGVENHKADYLMGDVVKCRVISCKRRLGRHNEYVDEDAEEVEGGRGYWELNLSLHVDGTGAVVDEDDEVAMQAAKDKSQTVRLQSGIILPPKSMKIVELIPSIDKKRGLPGFIPGHAIVRVKSKFITSKKDVSSIPYVECKIPFDQVLDTYRKEDVDTKEKMDAFAKDHLVVGKKIDKPGLVLTDPKKTRDEYASAIGKLPAVSLRPKLIETARLQVEEDESNKILVPSLDTGLYMGALVQGYVHQVDPRHGAFVHFLQGMTGLIPKIKKGTEVPKWETITCKIIALDVTCRPPKILLQRSGAKDTSAATKTEPKKAPTGKPANIKVGDKIDSAEVLDVNFSRATLSLGDGLDQNVRARLHVTMAECETAGQPSKRRSASDNDGETIRKGHPFYKWKVGKSVSNLTCVSVSFRNGVTFVELSSRVDSDETFVEKTSDLEPGMKVSCIVVGVTKSKRGIWVQPSPGLSCFVPALELSHDADVLNNLSAYYSVGKRMDCTVMDKKAWKKRKSWGGPKLKSDDNKQLDDVPFVSVLLADSAAKIEKPDVGELLVGRVNRSIRLYRAPALMLELRGGYKGRCCITELDELDEWSNMPLGRQHEHIAEQDSKAIVTDEDEATPTGANSDSDEDDDDEMEQKSPHSMYGFPDGDFVACRVLARISGEPVVEVSLRQSRLEGDLDNDGPPEENDLVNAYVVTANAKGCFLRLSRQVEGRVVLKELADGFLPDPSASFPMGRLVIGRVKKVKEGTKRGKVKLDFNVDVDMRESKLIDSESGKHTFEDVQLQQKFKGTVTRIEDYGVFVRLENSYVSGLVHKSECSDNYVKNIRDFYDPGDLVKVLIIKKDSDGKKLGFSMKASHFEGDVDSDDDSSDDEDVDMEDTSDDEDEVMIKTVEMSDSDVEASIDSDDENYVSKLAAKLDAEGSGEEDEEADSDNNDAEIASDDEVEKKSSKAAMDTNVGFNWGNKATPADDKSDSDDDSDEDSDDDDDDDEEGVKSSSHSSRKKAAARRREEEQVAKRERSLADGTAEPETAADFERLLAAEPNYSEHWIRYMAYYLSLADVDSARQVAHRALGRMDFTNETEKLNIWTALLALELKFGHDAFQDTIDKACQSNNPKQVYLRACELVQKQAESAQTDALFDKMCKKFRSKKTVWIAYIEYLLQTERSTEAHDVVKRAIKSLPAHKHLGIMSKLAQLEFEHGDVERGRTVFDGILTNYPKRLDVLFVFIDKETKSGNIDAARSLFQKTTSGKVLKDKAMKKVFQKWFRLEQELGTDETQEAVKDAAREYVDRTTN